MKGLFRSKKALVFLVLAATLAFSALFYACGGSAGGPGTNSTSGGGAITTTIVGSSA